MIVAVGEIRPVEATVAAGLQAGARLSLTARAAPRRLGRGQLLVEPCEDRADPEVEGCLGVLG
jgi:hypothetical protein